MKKLIPIILGFLIAVAICSLARGEPLQDGFPEGSPKLAKEITCVPVNQVILACSEEMPFVRVNIGFYEDKPVGFVYFQRGIVEVGYYDKGFSETGIPSGEFEKVQTSKEVTDAMIRGIKIAHKTTHL